MSTETEIMEVKEEKVTSSDNAPTENQYKIFNYFKDKPAMLIACVSALVAIGSWLLRFAVGRMNYAYLAYWDIATLHANNNNPNELYMVAGILLFTLVLMIIHSVLNKLSDTFRYYIPLLLLTNRSINLSKKEKQAFLKELRKLYIRFSILPLKKKKSIEGITIKKEIEKHSKKTKEELKEIQRVKKARQFIRIGVMIQVAFDVFLLYLLGSMFFVLINMSGTIRDSIQGSWVIALFILLELADKYIPAYREASRSCKQYKDEEALRKARELLSSEMPKFPLEALKSWEIKAVLSDKVLKSVMVSILTGMIIIILSISFAGSLSAKMVRSFPMYTDGDVSYAVVYTSGSTRYMEEAVIEDGTLIIDTTKQRIITSEDITYTVEVFDDVSVIRIDEALKVEKDIIPVEKVFTAIGSFLKTIWSAAEEVLSKYAKRIPRI